MLSTTGAPQTKLIYIHYFIGSNTDFFFAAKRHFHWKFTYSELILKTTTESTFLKTNEKKANKIKLSCISLVSTRIQMDYRDKETMNKKIIILTFRSHSQNGVPHPVR